MPKPATIVDVPSEKVWLCECRGGHYLVITKHYWPDEEIGPEVAYLTIDGDWHLTTWKDRIKQAWQLLWYGENKWVEIFLSKKTATEIRDELTSVIEWLPDDTSTPPPPPDTVPPRRDFQGGTV